MKDGVILKMIKFEISYNEYQDKYVVFQMDLTNFNIKGIFSAPTRKACTEWLKQNRKGTK